MSLFVRKNDFKSFYLATGHWSPVTAFTLLEILIVISIIAILAVAVVPKFIGFDTEARITSTKSNLDTLNTTIGLFRVKEGRYPQTLEELTIATYNDMGIEKNYLEKIPTELISSKGGSNEIENISTVDTISGDGGWVYYIDKAKVIIDWDEPLDTSWGDAEGEVPSKW